MCVLFLATEASARFSNDFTYSGLGRHLVIVPVMHAPPVWTQAIRVGVTLHSNYSFGMNFVVTKEMASGFKPTFKFAMFLFIYSIQNI